MNRGSGKPKTTLGDLLGGVLEQWKANKSDEGQGKSGAAVGETRVRGDRNVEERLRSWKRGGSEVKVTKGTSTGYEWRKSALTPPIIEQQPGKPESEPEVSEVASTDSSDALPTPAAEQKSLRQRLAEASADISTLHISSATSRPRPHVDLAPVVEDPSARLAILGLDFGTAFTKAVVRWSGRHHAVDWSAAVEGEDDHLLASVFSESSDGRCMLGACDDAGWSVREGIKLRLLSSASMSAEDALTDAVIFVALAFRYVHSWLRQSSFNAGQSVRWRLHLGLPTKSWDNSATTENFKSVAQAARLLALMPGPVTRSAALEALTRAEEVERPAVDVFPEFACQLYSYLQSPERSEDLHALVDIGAGTLDLAYFNVFMKDGDALLPIFSSEVEQLGAHYLIAALAGRDGPIDWLDAESALSDKQAGLKVGCAPSEVERRRSLYLSSVAKVFNSATAAARQVYPTSPAFNKFQSVRLFLCGGGSRIPSLKQRFNIIAREARCVLGVSLQISQLVKPGDFEDRVDSGFDRISVAYGLSQLAGNIGNVMRSATLDALAPRERVDDKHRDDDR